MSATPAPQIAAADSLPALLVQECRRHIAAGHRPVLGLNGPVGAGKSTLSACLRESFASAGLRLAVASIDDAYLPLPLRRSRMAGNPFGVSRVPPGSHDPSALLEPIRCWRQQHAGEGVQAGAWLTLPRFDKRLCGGEGDRVEDWQGEADVVLLEGWLLGCRPVSSSVLLAWSEQQGLEKAQQIWLLRCNEALRDYQPLWDVLDALLMLWPRDWRSPRRWRLQAESRQRRAGGGWLTPPELERIVQASLGSLPPELYVWPLLSSAFWIRELDGRRRCLWQGSGDAMVERLTQPSSSCSSATG
ncbi:MAG: hypothetical protein RLZZ137_1042 [Cyanobacteriota bacterium]|jgi:D-glycerate 3-kinase